MKAFSIDTDKNITVHASAKAAQRAEGVEVFASQKVLAELAAIWPASRLIGIWNSLPGVKPVRKFTEYWDPGIPTRSRRWKTSG